MESAQASLTGWIEELRKAVLLRKLICDKLKMMAKPGSSTCHLDDLLRQLQTVDADIVNYLAKIKGAIDAGH